MNGHYSLISLIFLQNLVVGDILFKDSNDMAFLEANFTNTQNHIFPRNCTISIHLTRISGLLFYSIDSNLNQLIINLQDTKEPTMKIEFRNDKHIVKMKDLCNCNLLSCLYEKIDFTIQINDTLNIYCSKGSTLKMKLANKLINNDYPIPSFNNSNITAYLWLINIPMYDNKDKKVYPNAEYLTGCLHNVEYDGKPVTVTSRGPVEECNHQCPSPACGENKCLETYLKPKCDCKESFYNGEFCNISLSDIGVKYFDFKFKIMKLSWKWIDKSPENGDILHLKNSNHQIKVYLKSKNLIFLYLDTNLQFEFTIEIWKNMSSKSKNVLLIEFEKNQIFTTLNFYKNQTNSNVFINTDLSETEFNKIYFLHQMNRNNVLGDVAYKVSKSEIDWLPAKLEQNLKNIVRIKRTTRIPTTTEKIKVNTGNILIAFISIFGIIDVVLLILIWILKRKRR